MQSKVYSFRDEEGHSVKYNVKEFVTINKQDYVIMSPEENNSVLEVYKFNIENGNESLELVEDTGELSRIKSASKIM